MNYSKPLVFLTLVAPAVAFVLPSSPASRSFSSLCATRDTYSERATTPQLVRNLAAASAITLGLLFPSTDAIAAEGAVSHLPLNDHALHSSTVELSVEIKTMDFSMPSSYDSIADPVASGTDELTNTVVVNTAASKKSSKKNAASKGKTNSAPSSGLSAKEASAAKRAERVAQREADEAAAAARAEEALKERDANIKAARLERVAAREAAKAEKEAAAAAENEEAKFKGVKFVDTSMPSY